MQFANAIADKKLETSMCVGQKRRMKFFSIAFAVLCLGSVTLFAQGKIDLQLSDSIHDILDRNVGQTVELHLRSGEKIGGKVEAGGHACFCISHLRGGVL